MTTERWSTDNDRWETGARPRTTISDSRLGCRLPAESILRDGEGTITREEHARRGESEHP